MSTPFVARADEVARLVEALDRARSGVPSLVLLGADAGVGKTRLVRHVAEVVSADGALVVTGHCVDLGEVGLPYLPFAEALGLLREADPEGVTAAVGARPALGRLLGAGAPVPQRTAPAEVAGAVAAAEERRELFEGVLEVVSAVASPQRPLLLVLEDLHWADGSSRDLLRFLVSRLGSLPVLVVATYRSDDLHRRHPWRAVVTELVRHPSTTHLELFPFTDDELGAFAAAVAGHPLPPDELRRLRERAEGNAYFTEELIESGAVADALPWSLADVLRSRVERLDPTTVRLVQLASASGRRVPEPLLRAAAEADTAAPTGPGVDTALREAIAGHVLVVEDGHVTFRHALLAEAVYGDLLPGEAASAHRAFLAALGSEPGARAAARASHALRVPDLPVALTASWQAAEQARRVLAPAEELSHLELVLRLWDAVPDVAAGLPEPHHGVLQLAAGAAARAGEVDRAVQLARSAVTAAPDDAARGAARTVLARHLLGADDVGNALSEATTALAELSPDPSPARAWALATYARAALNTNREDEAVEVATRARQVAREVGDVAAESDALTTAALSERLDHHRSADLLTEALARVARSGDGAAELRIHYNLATTLYEAGDLDRTAEAVAAGTRRADALGMTWAPHGADLRVLGAIVRFVRGDLTPAPRPRAASAPPQWSRAILDAADLYAAAARGDADTVERAAALEAAWASDSLIALHSGGSAVDALTWRGEHDRARQLADRVDDHLQSLWSPEYLGGIRLHALALAAVGDAAAARRSSGASDDGLVAEADARLARVERTVTGGRPRSRRLGPEGLAWAARARAEHARAVGRHDPDAWRAAVSAFSYGHRYETARCRWRLAEALVESGDRDRAAEEARTALAEADAMGAAPLAAAVADLVRRARLGGAPLPAGEVLTAREAEVLTLVARGLSNRQIGERLYISGKTVSVHVSNLLAKLGASGRTEAVAIAHRRGLLDPVSGRVSAEAPTV